MFDACPMELKETIIKLLLLDRFVDAKALLEDWRASQH